MAIDWARLREVLTKLISMPEGAREAELSRLEAADPEFGAELRENLKHHTQSQKDGFLESTFEEQVFPIGDELIAARIGPYRILRILGRGGSGTVFLAVREVEYEQFVAIKVLREHLDEVSLTRFKLEVQSLALLKHENIVRLLDAGKTDSGLPYFVMEYVDGESIVKHSERNRLTIESRVRLLKTAAEAIAFAHKNEILHRDLSPSNILVEKDGAIKVIDFGFVRRLTKNATSLSRTGMIFGTPGYAAPEQLLGTGGTNLPSLDCYGLGAILYRLVAGQAINDSESMTDEVRSLMRRSELATPRKINPAVPIDLETIILKAVAREPDDRFETVDDFISQIELYLDGRPLTIRRLTPIERLERWSARNRRSILLWGLTAASILFFMLGGLIVANQRIRSALTATEMQRRKAEVSTDTLRTILRASTLAAEELTESLPLGSNRTHYYLDHMANLYEIALAEIPGGSKDLELRYRTALAHHHLARSFDARDSDANRPVTIRHYDRAVELLREITRESPKDRVYRSNLSRTLAFRSYVNFGLQKFPDAEADVRDAVRVAEELSKDYPDDLDLQDLVAFQYNNFANILGGGARREESRKAVEAALKIARDVNSKANGSMGYIENIERAVSRLALLAENDERFADAETYLLEAIKINERRNASQDEVHYTVNARNCLLGDLARINQKAGEFAKSDEYYTKAIEGAKGLAAKYPQTDSYVLLPYRLMVERVKSLESRGEREAAGALRTSTTDQLKNLIEARPNLLEAKKLKEELERK